jgi:UDP:flavonoid glycosyltransferase YjiC (YdhE family)
MSGHEVGVWTGVPTFSNTRPTVLVTLGTIFHNPVVLSAILRGLADLNVNILATVGPNGDPAELDVDPSRVRIERFVPLNDLLTNRLHKTHS